MSSLAPPEETAAAALPDTAGDGGEVFVFPASHAQARLWFLHRMQPDGAEYNIHRSFRLRGEVRQDLLRRAVQGVVDRHESLRTTFAVVEGEPVQVIAPAAPAPLTAVDLSSLPPGRREEEAARLSTREGERPFDLGTGPLARFVLLRLGEDEHVLLYTLHHAITDGWSMRVLSREVTALYEALRRGEAPSLPDLPVQYADYAEWQRGFLAGSVSERQLAWWRRKLEGAPPVLELLTDRPRPAAPRFRGAQAGLPLAAGPAAGLAALARECGATPFVVTLAAFQALLGRWAGTDDVVVGTPVAGRSRPELEGVIGLFVNTLVLRADLSGDPTFRELVLRVREWVLEAQANGDVPFERLVEAINPPRQLGRAPLFQVTFTYETLRGGGGASAVHSRSERTQVAAAKFDLTAAIGADAAGALWISFTYDADLFEPATVARMLEQFRALLEQVAADADRRLSAFDLVSPDERRLLLDGWNDTGRDFPRRSVHALFRKTAAARPDAVALAFGGRRTTYAELDAWSDRLARVLRRRGVGADVRVAVALERGAELVAVLLAVLKAGGAYVPLDPAYPADRLSFMLADSGARVLVSRGPLPPALDADGIDILRLDVEAGEIDGESGDDGDPFEADALDVDVGPDRLAYVIYTSGSTGRPKGVAVPHRGIVRLVRETDYAQLGPDDRVAQASSVSFDAATWEIWGALLNGGTLVGVERDVALDPAAFAAEIGARGITALFLTTALFNLVARDAPDAFSGVRHLLFGGEAVDPERVRRVLEAGGPEHLLHVYGPTESTTYATWHRVESVAPGAATVPIGGPLAGTTLYVLDPSLGLAPIGVPCELYVGGEGLARGYLGRPALTAERFVPHPFPSSPGERLYRTGDRVRRRADGAVEFLGRLDQQVKIRGFRIEPAEVAAVLEEHPSVREAVVIVRGDGAERRLVAYATPATLSMADLRAFLRGRLPEFMVPSAFVLLDALPLNRNGKVDRRALPEPGEDEGDADYTPPRTPTEELLAAIWAEVLGRERVGVEDGFFEIGGHSLLAARVAGRVRQAFRVDLPLRAFFESSTVAAMADVVDAALRRGEADPLPPPVRLGAAEAPLSFAQQRLWFLHQVNPAAATYHVADGHRLGGALDVDALDRALTEVVRRHEALRTAFPVVDGRPVQRIAPPPARFPLPRIDLSALASTGREREMARIADVHRARPFDLERGPVFRALLVRLADDDHALHLVMHHAVSDGWSMDVLRRELSALYDAFSRGAPSPLAEPAVQYADFARWQREAMDAARLEPRLAYWRARLAGAPAEAALPFDRPRPPARSGRGASRSIFLSPEASAELRAVARREGATTFMVALAAWQALMARYTGEDDGVVGTPVAGRAHREVEGVIGFFVNTLVLRTDLSGEPTFRELLARVREGVLEAHAHQDVPFERLVEELNPVRALGVTPLFQVMFTYEGPRGGQAAAKPALRVADTAGASATAKFDLTAAAGDDGERAWLALTWDADLFDDATGARMLEHYRALIEGLAADPERRISSVDLVDADERRRLLVDWNAPAPVWPTDLPLHALFARQAAETPGAIAIVQGDERMTFAELDARSSRLARVLRRRGVGRGTRVALCLERTPDLPVAILAVLKAGGAYVPLDPSFPPERLAFMLADSGAAATIAHASLLSALPAGTPGVLCLDGLDDAREEIDAEGDDAPESGAGPEDLAYVIYTSGSTGRPKGTEVPHRAIPGFFAGVDYVRYDREQVQLQYASLSWDVLTLEMWPMLLTGGTCVLFPGRAPEPARLGEEVRRHGVTTLWLTSSFFNLLADTAPDALDGVRQVMVGGEAVSPAHLRKIRGLYPDLRLVNGYGPSECTVFACCHVIGADVPAPVPIGRPIGDRRVYVLDREGKLVPVGVPGELHVGGPAVPRGYLGRPALTAEKLVPDPFGPPGARLYRTGDRVAWRADGTLHFLGRMDTQVKVRGFRVEPEEIEAALLAHPSVRACVVDARADEGGEKRLVAYLVAEGDAPAPDALREHLRGRLPEYMLPAAFVALDALPLGSTGKVDRRALPQPSGADRAGRGKHVPPRDALEARLAAVWEEVLGVRPIGVRDDFFALGGHSLLAAQLVWRLAAEAPEGALTVATLFEASTVERLAAHLRRGGAAPSSPLVAIRRGGDRPPLFLVHPAGGNVLCYAPLSARLGEDQPLFGLQSRGLDGRDPLAGTVDAMADDYLRAMRIAHRGGPWLLGGWSMGGVVAVEVARRLTDAGGEPPLVALFDSVPPSRVEPGEEGEGEIEALGDVAHSLGIDVAALRARLPRDVLLATAPAERLERVLRAAGAAHLLEPARFARIRRLYEVYRANTRAMREHALAPYPGGLLLFRATDRRPLPPGREALGWDAVAPRVEVHPVPGSHLTMLEEPHVATLAAILSDRISRRVTGP